jgi:hypothetical protein
MVIPGSLEIVHRAHPGPGIRDPIRLADKVRVRERRASVRRIQIRSGLHGVVGIRSGSQPHGSYGHSCGYYGTCDEADEVLVHVGSPSVLSAFG